MWGIEEVGDGVKVLKYIIGDCFLKLIAANLCLFTAKFCQIFTCDQFPYHLFAADCPHTTDMI